MIYIAFFLFIIAGICEAVMDKIQFHYERSVFRSYKNQLFWDPKLSWRNKYKNADPLLGEKFFLSKRLLVGLTDAWHMFKLFRTFFIFTGIYFLYISCDFKMSCFTFVVVARVLYGLSFTYFFNRLED